jgi:8-oxo-dGTP pyrophosphatase MutT (NUDIX family)
MYKVFFNESIIQIDSEFKKSLNNNIPKIVDTESYDFVNQLVYDIESVSKECNFLILDQDINKIWDQFQSHFKIIGAAGGLVQNDEGSFLFIKRLGVWDLPKGKIEKRESSENAAIREVEEECGLSDLEIIRPLVSTFHIYRSPYLKFPKNLVLKETRWFLMHYSGNEMPVPQVDEQIEEVRWFAVSELDQVKANTYSSLIDFLKSTMETI